MKAVKVLLVEDNELWQIILQTHINLALPDSDPPRIVGTFQDGARELRQGEWDLIITDIGLPPDSGHILGMRLVSLAKEEEIPCIVVSGTEAVTKQLVRDLLLGRDYQARDFFSKEDLRSSPAIQRQFQDLVREIAAEEPNIDHGAPRTEEFQSSPSPATPQPSPDPVREPATAAADENLAVTAQPPPRPRKVAIGIRDSCLYLSSENLENLPLPKGMPERVFLFFVQNVSAGLPAKVVNNSVLNEAVGTKKEDSADPFLRKTIKHLNDRFRHWAHLPKDQRWIVKGSGEHGYCLNTTDVQWDLETGLKDSQCDAESIYYLLIDPHRLQGNTPNKGQRLPAQPKRKRPAEDDEEDER